MKSEQLKLLQDLVRQKRERDLAALTKARQQVTQADRQIEALREKQRQEQRQSADDLLVSAKWQGWAAQEQLNLAQARAQLCQSAEVARQAAAHSDAKTRVIGDLLQSALRDELQQSRRKAEQNGREPDK